MLNRITWIKSAVFIACLLPLGLIVLDGFQNNLTADPIEEILHRTGIWTLRILLVTLAMTPLRVLSSHDQKTGQIMETLASNHISGDWIGLFTFYLVS